MGCSGCELMGQNWNLILRCYADKTAKRSTIRDWSSVVSVSLEKADQRSQHILPSTVLPFVPSFHSSGVSILCPFLQGH